MENVPERLFSTFKSYFEILVIICFDIFENYIKYGTLNLQKCIRLMYS